MSEKAMMSARITPTAALAGDTLEITISLQMSSAFCAEGSRLVIDMPATLGASRPTCHNQEEDGYVAVFCSNPDVVYRKRCYNIELLEFITRESRKTNMDTDGAKRFFVIDFIEGCIQDGDELIIKYGYMREGMGCGAHITTNVLLPESVQFFDVRYFKEGERALPDSGRSVKGFPRPVPDQQIRLPMRLLPREPERLRLIHSRRGTRLLILDRFYNVCSVTSIDGLIKGETEGHFIQPGVYLFDKRSPHVVSCGLPIAATPEDGDGFSFQGFKLFAGDLHTHSACSNDCCEREKMMITPDEMCSYAKHVSALDFIAITDHHQPWDEERSRIGETCWKEVTEAVRKWNSPGTFLALSGFEFRDDRGDTPVIFSEPPSYEAIDDPSLVNVTALWDKLHGMAEDAVCIPHLHNPGWGVAENQWIECPYEGMEPVMDVYSCHGSYEWPDAQERGLPEVKRTRKDRFTRWFLQNGYHYGNTCNSDDHMGHPGSNGLTMVYAKELTVPALFEALRARRCYGTTNARIRLTFTANGAMMGSRLPQTTHKRFEAMLTGEQPFKAVDLVRCGVIYKRFHPGEKQFFMVVEVEEEGTSNWYVRGVQTDNHIVYSSPVWFE